MAKYLKHIRCDSCGSSDANAVYDDGSQYCFSCSTYKSGNVLNVIQKLQAKEASPKKSSCLPLPEDAAQDYSNLALEWAGKYGFTVSDLLKENNKIFYSDARQQLIFTFPDEAGNILAWQARNLAKDTPKSKRYFTSGDVNNLLPIYSNRNSSLRRIVLVEDCLSALKVLKALGVDAMPLLGSGISNLKLSRLRPFYDVLDVFLDPDMYLKSIDITKRGSLLGFKAAAIKSWGDPKEHSIEQLQELLT